MRKLLAFAAFPLLAFACSSDSEADDEDGRDPAAVAFIEDYCDAFMPCCAEAALPADGAECRSLLAVYTSGDFGFDEDAAIECSAWFDSFSGTEICREASTPVESCDHVFTPKGNRAPGETCDTAGDCALSPEGDVLCISSDLGPKRCQLIIEGTEGSAPCLWSVRDGIAISSLDVDEARVYSCHAADGLYCDGTSCAPLSSVGNACDDWWHCALESYCSAEGICVPQSAPGAACEHSEECAQGSCVAGVCVERSDTSTLLCGDEA